VLASRSTTPRASKVLASKGWEAWACRVAWAWCVFIYLIVLCQPHDSSLPGPARFWPARDGRHGHAGRHANGRNARPARLWRAGHGRNADGWNETAEPSNAGHAGWHGHGALLFIQLSCASLTIHHSQGQQGFGQQGMGGMGMQGGMGMVRFYLLIVLC